jgi:hypothetical protein
MKKILFVAVVFALFTTAASAQRGHDVVTHHRIQQGFHSGQLTRGEKARLYKNEARYRHERRKALRDGKLTRSEKRRLAYIRKHDSRRVYAMKHNARRRAF